MSLSFRAAELLAGLLLLGCETARARAALESDAAPPRPGEVTLAQAAVGAVASVPVAHTAFEPEPTLLDGCPREMAAQPGYCIDRYEASLETRVAERWLPHSAYEQVQAGEQVRARSAGGVVPQGYISRDQAAAACRHAGKRLCSVREWFAACQGTAKSTFPYGPRYENRRCNSGKIHVLTQLFGADPRRWSYELHFNSPRLNQEAGFLAKTGDFASCLSASGAYDMVGNLHEWVSDDVSAKLPKHMPVAENLRATVGRHHGNGIFLGGFYSTLFEHGRGCEFITLAHEPSYHDYSTGFRCCQDRKL